MLAIKSTPFVGQLLRTGWTTTSVVQHVNYFGRGRFADTNADYVTRMDRRVMAVKRGEWLRLAAADRGVYTSVVCLSGHVGLGRRY